MGESEETINKGGKGKPSENRWARGGNKKSVGCVKVKNKFLGHKGGTGTGLGSDVWIVGAPVQSGRTGKKTRSEDHVSTGPPWSPSHD